MVRLPYPYVRLQYYGPVRPVSHSYEILTAQGSSRTRPRLKCSSGAWDAPRTCADWPENELAQETHGVDRPPIHAYLEVEVRSGGVSGRADRADRLPFLDLLAVTHEDLGEVAVQGRHRAAVVDDDHVAVTAVVPAGRNNAAFRRCQDGGAHLDRDIDAGVHDEA